MGVLTVAEAKAILNIADNCQNDRIAMFLPIIESEIKDYCNQPFVDAPATPSWEMWMKIPAAEMIGYLLGMSTATSNGMKSESQGGYSYTRGDMVGSYPASIMRQFDRVKVARIQTGQVLQRYRDSRGYTAQDLLKHEPMLGTEGLPYYEVES